VPVLYLRIPDDRIGALIGPGGATRRTLEEKTGTEIELEEEEGVRLSSPDDSDPIGILKARDIVLAIGRGFSPDRAFRLLKEDTYLGVVDIKRATGKRAKSALWRIRSRIIGTGGRARERIEELSGCAVSVQGSTVALIGDEHQLERATRAVQLLLRGSEHSTVFRMLAHERREAALSEAMAVPEEPSEEP
jgi:ribosomal RNA assembly protein